LGAWDSFDYAISDNIVHLAAIGAMGHGLNAAILATLAIGAHRHAPRAGVGLFSPAISSLLVIAIYRARLRASTPTSSLPSSSGRNTSGRLLWRLAGLAADMIITEDS
jgi:hypothetical protein